MNQVIVYTNSNGGVSVCVPSLNQNINEVLEKNCPDQAIIVDSSTLPSGADAQFFNSWELNGSSISVNFTKAQSQQTSVLNKLVYDESGHRAVKTLSGSSNVLSDNDWKALVATSQSSISSATTTDQLVAAIAPVQTAIAANAAI
jgi:hypothetical protein